MRKHGVSHAVAVLVCTVSSALLADVVRRHVPAIHDAFNRVAVLIVEYFSIHHRAEYITILIYATFLAAVWGAAFAVLHSDR